jgi:hypothetical protein
MEKRTAEQLHVTRNSGDFVVRSHNYIAMHGLSVALSFIMVALAVTLYIIDQLTITTTLFVVIGAMCWYVSIHITRNYRLLNATEFQNAMFASALAMGSAFCIILTRDGGFVYFDRSFQGVFPEFIAQPARSLDIFMEMNGLSKDDKEKIRNAIHGGSYEKIDVDLRYAGNNAQKVTLLVEPILRPSGYVLVRGHDAAHPSNR